MDDTPRRLRYPFEDAPSEGEVVEVASGIFWMRMPLPGMGLDHVNVYALEDNDGWTIVDSSISTRRTKAIWEDLLAGPLGGKPVHRLIVTHHHPDHVGLAGWFQSQHGADLLMTRTAWLFARMLSLDVQDRPAEETVAYYKGAGMDPEVLAKRMDERPFNFADALHPLPLGFTQIREATRLRIGERNGTVRLGGGHAPDHATLWSDDDDVVIGGDQLLPSISPNLGVYATEPEADPVSDWLESCSRLSAFASEAQLVLPGHKKPFTGLPTRLEQLIHNHHGALERLRAHLVEPRTAVECFRPLFKREIGGGEYGLALVEAMAHCLHLWHLGEVRRTRRADGAWLWQMETAADGRQD